MPVHLAPQLIVGITTLVLTGAGMGGKLAQKAYRRYRSRKLRPAFNRLFDNIRSLENLGKTRPDVLDALERDVLVIERILLRGREVTPYQKDTLQKAKRLLGKDKNE